MRKEVRTIQQSVCVALAAIVTTALTSNAQTNAPEKIKWETTAAAGFTLTSGNSETMLATLSLESKRKLKSNETLLGVAGGYGEDDGTKNTDFFNAYGQFNHFFNERLYDGIRLDGSHDGVANLNYRFRITPLIGYYLIKGTNTTLSVEVGPSAVFEEYDNQDPEDYLGIRFGEKFEHKLSDTTKIWQSVDYVPKVDEWTDKYTITAEAGISTSINKQWSLRVVIQDIYDSNPAPGNEDNDFRVLAGTEYKF